MCGNGKQKKPGETADQKAAAEVAVDQYDFAREMDFVKEAYESKIDKLGSEKTKALVRGKANIAGQRSLSDVAKGASSNLNSSGVDPSSGRATTTNGEVYNAGGNAIGRGMSESEFATDTAYIDSRSNRIAMAMDEKTKAVAGLQDIADSAERTAINDSFNKFNSKAATNSAIGTAAGLTLSSLNSGSKPNETGGTV